MEGFAHEAITVGASAVGFTEATFAPASTAPAKAAYITCEGASCRYRFDGTDPTATTGHLLEAGDQRTVTDTGNLYKFRAIRDTVTSATLRVTYSH